MSSKKHKAKIGLRYIKNLRKRNSLILCGRWWSINITKPAFVKAKDKKIKKDIEKILKERGVQIPKTQDYWNFIKTKRR